MGYLAKFPSFEFSKQGPSFNQSTQVIKMDLSEEQTSLSP